MDYRTQPVEDGSIDWRWTSQPLTFFGLHGSVFLTVIPIAVTWGSWLSFVAAAGYIVFLWRCQRQQIRPMDAIRARVIRWRYGGRWLVRHPRAVPRIRW
jgi:hypothetical protein